MEFIKATCIDLKDRTDDSLRQAERRRKRTRSDAVLDSQTKSTRRLRYDEAAMRDNAESVRGQGIPQQEYSHFIDTYDDQSLRLVQSLPSTTSTSLATAGDAAKLMDLAEASRQVHFANTGEELNLLQHDLPNFLAPIFGIVNSPVPDWSLGAGELNNLAAYSDQ
ncbi:hypothetical protein MY4038_008595 [Beauveria bassiana]